MCGIFGIINSAPKKFDYTSFVTLGIANDARGGDSCGICIDGIPEYGVEKEKYFSNFVKKSTLLPLVEECQIALGHCRKASVGKVDLDHAQPVVIRENDVVKFVVLHNGTIYNYEELAKKYIPEIDIKDMSDSQVMAHIFYHKGFDVLSEYNGGSVFLITDYRKEKPTVYIFKGASKKNSYQITAVEERPFYFISNEKDEVIFSSIYEFLIPLRRDQEIYTVDSNTLYKIENGDICDGVEYNRDKCQQDKVVTYFPARSWGDDDEDYSLFPKKKSSYTQETFIYIRTLPNDIYTIDGFPANGVYYISNYGRCSKAPISPTTYSEVKRLWFFNGIPMPNVQHYACANYCFKHSGLPINEFCNKYILLLKYLSIQQIHFVHDRAFFVKSPTEIIPYTGDFQTIGEFPIKTFHNGTLTTTTYGATQSRTLYFNPALLTRTVNVNEIKRQWRQLMRSQEK